jgi:predicted LPLAT superfamily acyltransferase
MSGETQRVHWSEYREEAAGYWHVKLILIFFRIFPVVLLRVIALVVSFFYYIFSERARAESCRYLERIDVQRRCPGGSGQKPLHPLPHIASFSLNMIEKVEAWGGKAQFNRVHFNEDDVGELIEGLENGRGALLLTSHLGNIEFTRALAGFSRTGISRNVPVTGLMDISVTGHFNRMIQELNPESGLQLISVSEVGPETVILLQERIARGELVAIAGDRTSANTRNKYFYLPFLGREAPFAYGSFLLAALLNAPSYFIFALRQKDLSLSPRYDMHIHRVPIDFNCSRKEREQRMEQLARLFAGWLEHYCILHPYQWYNFYDFWAEPRPLEHDKPGKRRI